MKPETLDNLLTIFILPLLNIITAFAVATLLFLIIGENPLEVATIMFNGAFGYQEGIGYTLYYGLAGR